MDGDYLTSPAESNSGGTLTAAAAHLAQARLLLLRQSTQTLPWRPRQALRQTIDKLEILVNLVSRRSRAEVTQ